MKRRDGFSSFSSELVEEFYFHFHLLVVGNRRDETEMDSSSKTFGLMCTVAVVFTRQAFPRLVASPYKRRNNHLIDRGEESDEKFLLDVCGVLLPEILRLLPIYDATRSRIDAHLFHHSFHFSFVSLHFLSFQTWVPRITCSGGAFTPFSRGLSWMQLDSLSEPIAYKLTVNYKDKVKNVY